MPSLLRLTYIGLSNWDAYPPSKEVLLKVTYTGNDSVDAAPGTNWPVAVTALTPDPNNTLLDKLLAFDPTFDPVKFPGCVMREVTKGTNGHNYGTGFCNSFAQGSPAWLWAYDLTANTVVAMGPEYANSQNRWCGNHGTGVVGSVKWTSIGSGALGDTSTGQWATALAAPITTETTITVTAPQWKAATAFSNSAVGGSTIVDTNNNMEVATTGGTSGNSLPVWNTTVGGTTIDGTITWTNEGTMQNIGEPQNLYARTGGNGKYWSYLMSAAGEVNGGSLYDGDLFQFRDATSRTGECVRIVSKGACTATSCTWNVARAVHTNAGASAMVGCTDTTPQPHAANTQLLALCEPYADYTPTPECGGTISMTRISRI